MVRTIERWLLRKCVFVGYPEGTKGFKLYDLSKKFFIRSRDVIFDEKKFHDFNDGHLSKPNPEFYHPASDEPQSEEPTVQNEAENANDRVAEENIPIPVRPVNENRDEAVGETFEENFVSIMMKFSHLLCVIRPYDYYLLLLTFVIGRFTRWM